MQTSWAHQQAYGLYSFSVCVLRERVGVSKSVCVCVFRDFELLSKIDFLVNGD